MNDRIQNISSLQKKNKRAHSDEISKLQKKIKDLLSENKKLTKNLKNVQFTSKNARETLEKKQNTLEKEVDSLGLVIDLLEVDVDSISCMVEAGDLTIVFQLLMVRPFISHDILPELSSIIKIFAGILLVPVPGGGDLEYELLHTKNIKNKNI